jgi:hypothetical protein
MRGSRESRGLAGVCSPPADPCDPRDRRESEVTDVRGQRHFSFKSPVVRRFPDNLAGRSRSQSSAVCTVIHDRDSDSPRCLNWGRLSRQAGSHRHYPRESPDPGHRRCRVRGLL